MATMQREMGMRNGEIGGRVERVGRVGRVGIGNIGKGVVAGHETILIQ